MKSETVFYFSTKFFVVNEYGNNFQIKNLADRFHSQARFLEI